MDIKVEEVSGNPNPKAVTFKLLQTDLIAGFSKLIFTKTGTLKDYSPLATRLLSKGDSNKVDMFFKQGDTFITITRKLMDWDLRTRVFMANEIRLFLIRSSETPVFVDQIAQNVQTLKSFKPEGVIASLVSATFNQHVSPSLASHGGSIEVIDVRLGDDNKVTADIALIGSCDGCGTATTQTLAGAQDAITEVLSQAKSTKNKEPGHRIHLIHFDRFNLVNIPDLALTR